MEFLSVFLLLTLLARLSVSATIGKLRNLPAYNCLEYDINYRCIKCIQRAVNISGYCQAVSDLCKDWNKSNGYCT